MKLNVVFGMGLDGFLYPAGAESLNGARFGEKGFLEFLEGRAGIVVLDPAASAQRIAAYHKAMSGVSGAFYDKSFDIDPWGTAKTVLAWRDSLIAGGWDGETDFPDNPRLHTLYEIEKSRDAAGFKNGFADRLRAVSAALPDADTDDIGKIALTTPYGLLPRLWRLVLDALREKGVVCEDLSHDYGRAPEVVVLESDNDLTAAEVIAERLALADKDDGDIVLIGKDNAALNAALKKRGLPVLESNTASAHRSMLQVLPCLIEVMEKPLSMQKLYNFLRLPETPLTKGGRLAGVLEDLPGIGNKKWNERLKNLKEQEKDVDWDYWLGLAGKYEEKIPVPDLAEIVGKLKDWFGKKKGILVSAAVKQAEKFIAAAESFAQSGEIDFVQLRKILDSVSLDAENPYEEERVVSPWLSVSSPAKVLGAPKTAVWYDFRNDVSLSAVYPWTVAEEKALRGGDVYPATGADLAERAALEWNNVLRAEKLIVSVLKTDRGEEFEPHPFLDKIKAEAETEGTKKISKTVDASLSAGKIDLFGKTVKIDTSDLPEKTDAPVCVGKIDKKPSSATSMQALIDCPLKWYFHYRLDLGDNLPSLQSEPLALGSLAHKVVEILTNGDKKWPLWNEEKLKEKTEELFEKLVAEQAAFLSEKGREDEKIRVGKNVLNAVLKLKDFIADNKLEIVASEEGFGKDKELKYDEYDGSIDLRLKQGRKDIVLDMKYSDKKKYEDALKENKSVQLALYGKVLGTDTAGYFLMKSGRIIMNKAMEQAETVDAADLKETWDKVSKQAEQNLDDLKAGRFVPKWEDDVCEYCGYACLCGVEKKDNGNGKE